MISGFIIPYSLHRSGYSVQQYGRFLAKRIVRLDPPYIISIFVVVLLAYANAMTPGFRGAWPRWGAVQILGHLGYVNSVIEKPWINPVFWSLGIEFQYYLLSGLLAPLLVASPGKR